MLCKWSKYRRCRLKKEWEEDAAEKCPEITDLTSEDDCHQKVRDIKAKGPPGTKVDSMKVVLVHHMY